MIIVDTGFFLALANPNDRYHKKAKIALGEVKETLITTWPVITETCHLLLHRLSSSAQLIFLESFREGAFEVFSIPEDSLPRICSLMRKYHELPMDLADASLVLLAEHLDQGKILSTDERDFRSYRWKSRHPFVNLLF